MNRAIKALMEMYGLHVNEVFYVDDIDCEYKFNNFGYLVFYDGARWVAETENIVEQMIYGLCKVTKKA